MLYIGLILSYHKSGFTALSREQTLLFVIRGYYTITCGVFNTCLEKIMKRNENVLALAKRKMRVGSFAPGGAGYKTVKIIFIVASVCSVLMYMTVAIGNLVLMSEYSERSTSSMVAAYNEQRMYLITVVLLLLGVIAGCVLAKFRCSVAVAVLGAVLSVVSFSVFYGVSAKNDVINGGMTNFWLLFGVPSLLLAATSVALGVLIFIDKRRIFGEYDRMTAELYKVSTDGGSKKLSDEEFEKIMDGYGGGELFRSDIPLKRSQRLRRDKK